MSIDQDHLMRTHEQILVEYDRLRAEGKKRAEARQTVIDPGGKLKAGMAARFIA